MAKKKYEEANIQAIADAIREKTGTENTYDTSEMAGGVGEAYEAGKQSEWSAFWDSYQNNGNLTQYDYVFCGRAWTASNFKPKYDIRPTSASYMFNTNYNDFIWSDMDAMLARTGVVLDFSNCTKFQYMCSWGGPLKFGTIDIRKGENFNYAFSNAYAITIRKLIIKETNSIGTFFNNHSKLKNIEIEGVIGRSFPIQYSALTVDSMKSIISHLKDYSGLTNDSGDSLEFKYTLTFSSACWTTLEAEGATAEYTDAEGNTSLITWIQLIENKKWNRA